MELNKKIRKYIYDRYKKLNKVFNFSDSCNILCKELFREIDNISDKNEEVIEYAKQYYIISITFSDFYKALNEKYKANILNAKEEEMWYIINIAESIEHFRKIFDVNPSIQSMLIKGSIDFYESNMFGKISMHKDLNDKQVEHLKNICPTFSEDLETYNKNFNLDEYLKYILRYKNHLKQYEYLRISSKFDEIETLKNHLVSMFNSNPNDKVINELKEYYYKMNSFLESKDIDLLGYKDKNMSFYEYYNEQVEILTHSDSVEKMIRFWLNVETSCNNGIYNIKGFEFERDEFANYNYGEDDKKK